MSDLFGIRQSCSQGVMVFTACLPSCCRNGVFASESALLSGRLMTQITNRSRSAERFGRRSVMAAGSAKQGTTMTLAQRPLSSGRWGRMAYWAR